MKMVAVFSSSSSSSSSNHHHINSTKRRRSSSPMKIAAKMLLTCGGTVKPQTIIIVTIGIAILGLFSLEPVLVYESSSSSSSSFYSPDRPPGSSALPLPPLKRTTKTKTAETTKPMRGRSSLPSSRYGMVPKQSLRTPIMYPVDTMMDLEEEKTDISSRNRPTKYSHKDTPWFSNVHQTTTPQTKTPHPRVVFLGDDFDGDDLVVTTSWPAQPKTSLRVPPILMIPDPEDSQPIKFESSMSLSSTILEQRNETEVEILPFEKPFLEECEQQRNPQVHPTCNQLHELPMNDDDDHDRGDGAIALLNTKGSWRTAWTVQNDTAVLKVLQWSRSFDEEAYQHHALDVIVSDLLTASPYVIDAYGYCGQSILQEWAPNSGRDFVKSYDIRNRQRLRIARDLARGLADLQALQPISHESFRDGPDGPHNTTTGEKGEEGLISRQIPPAPPVVFSHNDINIANTIQGTNGRVKWNDFNIGVLLRTKKGSNFTEECGAPVKFRADLWRSPEEVRNTSYVQLQYTDMYGFGNILYQVMTRHQPWTHKEPEGKLTTEQVADRKRQGRLPTIPEQYRNTTNKDLQTMVLATISCYHPVPSKRLSAYELAHALSYVYDRLQRKQRVSTQMLRELFLSK